MENKNIVEYIKEFKCICDGLGVIYKPVDEDNKVINSTWGLGIKCKTFRIVILVRRIVILIRRPSYS